LQNIDGGATVTRKWDALEFRHKKMKKEQAGTLKNASARGENGGENR